ncbi:MAG: ATP-binding protein [Candidatus Margulisiibacteriota bacterium]
MFIQRDIAPKLIELSKLYPVVTITGPRQSGKTTLVKKTFPDIPYYSLEDPDIRELAINDPRGFLQKSSKKIILDEIQKVPELLSYIQGIVDIDNISGQFILTGSQQFELAAGINQSLAGRTALLKLLPLTVNEIESARKKYSIDEYLVNGFYPRIYDKKIDPTQTYKDYFETYVQRDLKQLINIKDLMSFRKFVKLCAGRTGQIFIASTLANEVGVSVPTINSWISILEASYIIFLLEPYYENIGKRLIKSPKIYFYDVGLASYLLGIENTVQVSRDPLRGALVENLVILELIKNRFNQSKDHNLFFYRDKHKNEIDVIIKSGHEIIPVEIKSSSTFHVDFLKGIDYISKIIPDRIKSSYVVYTGNIEQTIHSTSLINYKHLNEIRY